MSAAVAELPKVQGRHRNKALAAARRVRAVELKTAGYTYAQVADELGYTSRGTAYNIVAKALRDQTAEAVTDLRPAAGNVRCRDGWDIGAAVAFVKIVQVRAHLAGEVTLWSL